MEQIDMLPQQSLQTIANWGITFSAKPTEHKELIQIYGKPLYDGAIAFSKWWRSLSIGQVQAINQIDFPYWTLTLARKLAKVPLKKLDNCLVALQNTQKSVSKLSRILNKFIAPKKLSFGRTITSDDWDLIARSFDLDSDCLDDIRQLALRINGSSTQAVTTDDVIEILREGGYPIEQILPKPRIKRYSRTEVERVLQERDKELLAALERSSKLEKENEWLRSQLRSPANETTVEVTPIVETPASSSGDRFLEQPDVFENCLSLWEAFGIGDALSEPKSDRVLVIDKGDNDYYGRVGEIIDRDENNLDVWWVQFSDGDCQRFGASAFELLSESQSSECKSTPRQERILTKFKKIEQVPFKSNLHPMAG